MKIENCKLVIGGTVCASAEASRLSVGWLRAEGGASSACKTSEKREKNAARRRRARARKKSKATHVESHRTIEEQRALLKEQNNSKRAPKRFQEMMHWLACQPGKVRIVSRRLRRWMKFRGQH